MAQRPTETSRTSHGCKLVVRRVDGPLAHEIFISCQPPPDVPAPGAQAEAAYLAVLEILSVNGCGYGGVVAETLFMRNVAADLEDLSASRGRIVGDCDDAQHSPATTILEQPPLEAGCSFEMLIQAIVPIPAHAMEITNFRASSSCDCSGCSLSQALRVQLGNETRFYMGAIYGCGRNAYEQTHAMFKMAEELLQQADMTFSDVIRTWIYLPEMARDYGDLNSARREFYTDRCIDPVPASTGIGAGLVTKKHDIGLCLYAVASNGPIARSAMSTPTLNEAAVYGADFSRGMLTQEANRLALHISGTASIDECGETVHVGDLDRQVDRMLLNVANLLEGQGASFNDVAYAITYLKHPRDTERLREKFSEARFEGFPNVLVEATVCRPELLCETEVLAVIPIAEQKIGAKT